MRKAWTMVELIFVIVIIGVLAGIAVPKFSDTKDAATISSAKATIASVQASLSTERQLRVLKGDFKIVNKLNEGGGAFSTFSGDTPGVSRSVLENTVPLCDTGEKGCWSSVSNASGTTADPSVYTYKMPDDGAEVTFNLANGRFNCVATDENCKKLTQ